MSDLESLVPQRFGALTVAEVKLLRSAGLGGLSVCGPNDNQSDSGNDPTGADNWGADRSIRGELISWLCSDRTASDSVGPGGIQVLGAKVIGHIECLSVTIQFPLVFVCCKFHGDFNLLSARARFLNFTQTHLQSIFADGAVFAGAVFLRRCAMSQVTFSGARIEGQFDCSESTFDMLTLDGGEVGVGLHLRRAKGRVKMTRARIRTDIDCEAASFSSVPGISDAALDAGGVNVEGSVFLRNGFRADGLVLLHGAQIGSNFDCAGGQFVNPAKNSVEGTGMALNFELSVIGGTVLLANDFKSAGVVSLTSSQIRGDLRCTNASFGGGLVAERAVVKGALFWRDIQNPDTVSLNLLNTSVDFLSDDEKSWPSHSNLQLHGFTYSVISLASRRDATSRLDWLSRLGVFTPQPYRQLAKALRDEGDDVGSRQVLYKLADIRAQENVGLKAKVWSFILKYAVGYGYYPGLALVWLAGLALAGFVLFGGGYSAGIMIPTDKEAYASFRIDHRVPDYYERFHPLVYSAENSFPLVKLGQVDRWQPDPSSGVLDYQAMNGFEFLAHSAVAAWFLRTFRWAQIVLGWFFTTMGIAGITGIVRRD